MGNRGTTSLRSPASHSWVSSCSRARFSFRVLEAHEAVARLPPDRGSVVRGRMKERCPGHLALEDREVALVPRKLPVLVRWVQNCTSHRIPLLIAYDGLVEVRHGPLRQLPVADQLAGSDVPCGRNHVDADALAAEQLLQQDLDGALLADHGHDLGDEPIALAEVRGQAEVVALCYGLLSVRVQDLADHGAGGGVLDARE
mmetsp:Transcript_75167/g.220349  ORF Transcript_75167/g.220349 Transcript_75167/m.220349 type:complete len:200 (+) Transcript_75167:110-709(+)